MSAFDEVVEAVAEAIRARYWCKLINNRQVSDFDRNAAREAIAAYHRASARIGDEQRPTPRRKAP